MTSEDTMDIDSYTSHDGATLEIRLGRRFDAKLSASLRALQERSPAVRDIVVDLSETEYMDSSALGLLLVLREWAAGRGGQVRLQGPRPMVRKILGIAHFERIFNIAA